jgi:hypothetical protein
VIPHTIANVEAAVPAFEKKCSVGTIAAVAVEAANPSGHFITDMQQSTWCVLEQPLQFLRRAIHRDHARPWRRHWLIGVGRAIGWRAAVANRLAQRLTPFLVPRPCRLGIAFNLRTRLNMPPLQYSVAWCPIGCVRCSRAPMTALRSG